MNWESTDNFGNLMVATSEARDEASLISDLESMREAVFARHMGPVTFSVDAAYAEVAAPGADAVSHVLSVPWLLERMAAGESRAEAEQAVMALIWQVCEGFEGRVKVMGPWE